MDRKNILGMICGYYLSRFDEQAYSRLGHGSQSATHSALGALLEVQPRSIQNWRDEFDCVHDNRRKGWRKREMYPSRKRVIEALGDLSESEVYAIVASIMATPNGQAPCEIIRCVGNGIADDLDQAEITLRLRGVTGFKAENAFVDFHSRTGFPVGGLLRDCRAEQCGYDFAIDAEDQLFAVEVKGLAGLQGGVSFTDKEWQVAKSLGENYFLAIVRDVESNPDIDFIKNPAKHLKAEMRVFTTVQISWSIGHSKLASAPIADLE